METKRCRRCNKTKPLTDFMPEVEIMDYGARYWCLRCIAWNRVKGDGRLTIPEEEAEEESQTEPGEWKPK